MAAASALALVGVMLVVFSTDSAGALFGIALTLGGVAACAVYTVIARKLMVEGSTLTALAVQQTWALGFSLSLLAAVALAGQPAPLSDVSPAAWISAIASGFVLRAGVLAVPHRAPEGSSVSGWNPPQPDPGVRNCRGTSVPRRATQRDVSGSGPSSS